MHWTQFRHKHGLHEFTDPIPYLEGVWEAARGFKQTGDMKEFAARMEVIGECLEALAKDGLRLTPYHAVPVSG